MKNMLPGRERKGKNVFDKNEKVKIIEIKDMNVEKLNIKGFME
jgi:hypothetical protein